ncbi:hypothetical protein BDV25DRAFT_137327 [Aspergillus avenaceus]|uniref:Uncharacterized protein n=1 Tax=Aspergillus avenaceus TaxID=36643 RepID=A0A5N6U3E7_ASPAV|nr:hypothetical protein BDV25DRAFT_137327 [Aspergillus avenaceus]
MEAIPYLMKAITQDSQHELAQLSPKLKVHVVCKGIRGCEISQWTKSFNTRSSLPTVRMLVSKSSIFLALTGALSVAAVPRGSIRAEEPCAQYDLSTNPGGNINSGYDLFRTLFPTIDLYTAARIRTHDPRHRALRPRHLNQTTHYKTWEEYYGPETIYGANYTRVAANLDLNETSTWETPIRGRQNGSLRRPAPERPHASQGRLKGSQVAQNVLLDLWIEVAKQLAEKSAEEEHEPILSLEERRALNETAPNAEELPFNLKMLGVNLKNAYLMDDHDVPVQFRYKPADCGMFYTYENFVKPASVWVDAARVVIPASLSNTSVPVAMATLAP